MKRFLFCALAWLLSAPAHADVSLETFLNDAFAGTAPPARMLWLTPPVKQRATMILGHAYPGLRVKYWAEGERTAWVLDEIGKEQPITTGVVVEQGRIVQLRVLAFRESRGGEIQHGFFTRQFKSATLKPGDTLDHAIDGITGATLSVSAVSRVARLALAFHDEVMHSR